MTIKKLRHNTQEMILSFRALALGSEDEQEKELCDFACSILQQVLSWTEE